MITEDFCSFEVAKLFKEKGFDEECRAYWDSRIDDLPKEYEIIRFTEEPIHQPYDNMHSIRKRCLAPTHQMAMKWLREVHKIQICVEQNPYDVWHYWGFSMSYIDEKINELPNPTQAFIHICPTKIPNNCYKTYEEAVEIAIKYCLENLI